MKENTNLYELLNEGDWHVEDYSRDDLSQLEKKKLKQSFRKNRKRGISLKKAGIVAAVVLITLGISSQTGVGRSVYGAVQSKIYELSYSIGKTLGIEQDIQPYANVVNQVIENKGIEVKLTDVIIDQDELIFSTIINANRSMAMFNFDYEIYINGIKIKNYSRTGTAGEIEKNLYFENYAVDIKGINTGKELDIRLILKDLTYYEDFSTEKTKKNEVKGKWEFAFLANGTALAQNTQVIPVDHTFFIEDQAYLLETLRLNPVNQKITGTISGNASGSYQIDLRGFDNLGNEVVFYLSRTSGEDFIFQYQKYTRDFSEEITSLTLTPYAAKLPEESGRLSNDYQPVGEAFTINLN